MHSCKHACHHKGQGAHCLHGDKASQHEAAAAHATEELHNGKQHRAYCVYIRRLSAERHFHHCTGQQHGGTNHHQYASQFHTITI